MAAADPKTVAKGFTDFYYATFARNRMSLYYRPNSIHTRFISSSTKIAISEIGHIIDPYVPPHRFPLPFTKDGRAALFKSIQKLWMSTVHKYKLKKDLKFVPKQFPLEAEQLYIQMNKAFAGGRPKDLNALVTMSMLSTLKNQQAQIQKLGNKLSWEYLGAVTPPKTAHLCYVRHPDESLGGVAQVTIKIHAKQRLSVHDPMGKQVSQTESNPVEYVVYERFVRPGGAWRIAGKVQVTE